MTKLKRLGSLGVLTCVLGVAVFAGESPSSACGPNPGEIQTPPCSSAPIVSDDTPLGSPAPDITDITDTTDVVITEAAIELLQSVLLIF